MTEMQRPDGSALSEGLGPLLTKCADCRTPNSCTPDGACLEAYIGMRLAMLKADVERLTLTAEQVAALTIMLDHYKGDPRTECLRSLVYGPNVRANRPSGAAQE